jgi:hypothetical protein
MQTPDCSVEMGITSLLIKHSTGRNPSALSEESIIRDNPFFPKVSCVIEIRSV